MTDSLTDRTSTAKRGDGYDVYLDGIYIGYLRRPTSVVFESDARKYWVARNAEGTKRAIGRSIAEAAHMLAKEADRLGRLY